MLHANPAYHGERASRVFTTSIDSDVQAIAIPDGAIRHFRLRHAKTLISQHKGQSKSAVDPGLMVIVFAYLELLSALTFVAVSEMRHPRCGYTGLTAHLVRFFSYFQCVVAALTCFSNWWCPIPLLQLRAILSDGGCFQTHMRNLSTPETVDRFQCDISCTWRSVRLFVCHPWSHRANGRRCSTAIGQPLRAEPVGKLR